MKPTTSTLILRDFSPFLNTTIKYMRLPDLTLLLLFTLALADVSYAAGRVFFDDFEDGTISKFSPPDSRDPCKNVSTAIDGGSPRTGSRMLQCNWNGTVAWNDPAAFNTLSLNSWSYNNEFFIRLWVRADSDVDQKFGSKWLRLYNQSINSFILDGQMEQAGGPIYSNIESVDGSVTNYNKWGNASLGDRLWHKVEIYVKQGLSNSATFRVWVDGSLQHEKTNFSSNPSNKWYPLVLVSNWSNNGPEWAHDANNHTYWDDIEIYSDTGSESSTSGIMSDASIKSSVTQSLDPPLNLQVK